MSKDMWNLDSPVANSRSFFSRLAYHFLRGTRMKTVLCLGSLAFLAGCYSVAPQWQLRQAQIRTYQVHRQGQQYLAQAAEAEQMAAQLSVENQQLAMEKQAIEQNLAVANERINNLSAERSQLHNQYKSLLTSLPSPDNPMSGGLTGQFEDLALRYPNFEFDPNTGVSKFNGDLLFPTGSDQIQPDGYKLLKEFAAIMNNSDSRQFKILVVGHTDDQPIVKPSTRAKHPSNWDLSAHRASAVVKALAKYGIDEPRMGLAGYSKYQPKTANSGDDARQQNRRVEIFILAQDANIAGADAKPIR